MKFNEMLPGGKDWEWTRNDWSVWFVLTVAIGAVGFGLLSHFGVIAV